MSHVHSTTGNESSPSCEESDTTRTYTITHEKDPNSMASHDSRSPESDPTLTSTSSYIQDVATSVSNYVVTEIIPDTGDSSDVQVGTSGIGNDMTLDTCLVCGDRGSGYHYSVYTCEGCKGFFKRSVQKCLNYTCKENQLCVINKYTRNSCQHCRFQKCMEVGMKRDAVREDRAPGGKHRHKRPRLEEGRIRAPVMTELMTSETMPHVSSAPATSTTTLILPQEPYDDQLVQRLIAANPTLYPRHEDRSGGEDMDINDLMQYGYLELRYIIDWARKVPGFSDLLIEDQMALLKSSFMELNVLRLAYRSMDCDGSVKFADGLELAPDQTVSMGWGNELVNCTLEYIKRLHDVRLDETEFSILNAVVLCYPDAPGVQDKLAVTALQCKILDSLRKYVIRNSPTEPRRYGKILLRLPALRTVSTKAAERFLSMSLDGSVKMNALVLEIMS